VEKEDACSKEVAYGADHRPVNWQEDPKEDVF
jgi:hypothetical protein